MPPLSPFSLYRTRIKLKRAATKQPMRICAHCDSGFIISESHLNNHLRIEHTDLVFECEMCNRLMDKTDLINHMKSNLGKKRSCWKIQTAKIGTPRSQIKHIRRRFCVSLAVQYAIWVLATDTLRQHFQSRHSDERSFHWDCGKTFKTPSDLYTHKRLIHNSEFIFSCVQCHEI